MATKKVKAEDEDKNPLEILAQPLDPDHIEWRIQSQGKSSANVMLVPYLTNRIVMSRFDEAFGPMGWMSEVREVQLTMGNGKIESGIICRLSVKDAAGNWIHKEDGSSVSDIEPLKGGISGAMKRTAVQFGLGRSLYDFPKLMAKPVDRNGTDAGQAHYKVLDWAMPQLDKLAAAWAAGWTTKKDMFWLSPGTKQEWENFKIQAVLPDRVELPIEEDDVTYSLPPQQQPLTLPASDEPGDIPELGSYDYYSGQVARSCTISRFIGITNAVKSSKLTGPQKQALFTQMATQGNTWCIAWVGNAWVDNKPGISAENEALRKAMVGFAASFRSMKTIEHCYKVYNAFNSNENQDLFDQCVQDFFLACAKLGFEVSTDTTSMLIIEPAMNG